MITIMDGGMGQELLARSKNTPTEMWSARVLLDEPDLVTQVHADYIRAGAETITINAYSATPERLEKYGHGHLFASLQQAAIDCAHAARDAVGAPVKITGSLPPLYSSYNPDLNSDYDTALAIYSQIVDAQAAGVDIQLAETLGSTLEVRAALTAMHRHDKPKWISISLSDGTAAPELRSGEPLQAALDVISDHGADAVLINCSMPETITAAIGALSSLGIPFGAYGNGFTAVKRLAMGDIVADSLKQRTDLGPDEYAAHAQNWIDQGATLIGGCCEVGPKHIAELAQRFSKV